MLPAGVVLIGGGAKLMGIVEQAKKHLRLPARIGQVEKVDSVLDKAKDPSFCTAIGLAIWGNQMMGGKDDRGFDFGIITEGFKKFGKWLKNLKP